MVVGPFALVPLSHAIGRTSTIFWSTLLVFICNIWAACMTRPSQYTPYLISRFFAGFGAPVPSALGPRILLDLFFIHERGRAFSVLTLSYLLGTLAVPTVACFVASQTDWPIMFWWTIPFLGLALVLTIAVLKETGFEREGQKKYPRQPNSFVANRVATFLPGNKVVPAHTPREIVSPTVLAKCKEAAHNCIGRQFHKLFNTNGDTRIAHHWSVRIDFLWRCSYASDHAGHLPSRTD